MPAQDSGNEIIKLEVIIDHLSADSRVGAEPFTYLKDFRVDSKNMIITSTSMTRVKMALRLPWVVCLGR